jgi:hypothetical protein
MKITNNQLQEIDFLSSLSKESISEAHIKEFVDFTSKGIGKRVDIRSEKNPLMVEKRKLDITVKMWIEDMRD